MEESESDSYLDYDTFLDPAFSATRFANTLVLATNDASDTPLDLSTPLSRVLFDVQEVDTHLDKLTSTSALPLLNYTRENVRASERILHELETQLSALSGSYERLEREVVVRHEAAEETRLAATRVWETLKLGRTMARCLTLGRQLEVQMSELQGLNGGHDKKEDHGAMVRGANTILALRPILDASEPGVDVESLARINVMRHFRRDLFESAERAIVSRAEQVVGQFSMSSLIAQNNETAGVSSPMALSPPEDSKSRATSALVALYLLSPVATSSPTGTFEPSYLVSALQEYLKRAITSSLAGLSTALAALPKLERTLAEVSSRCRNIVALEILLESLRPPSHPLLASIKPRVQQAPAAATDSTEPRNLLQPLLTSLDTSSLPSYFWRSMASQLTSRVQRILRDGGVSARTLRSNRDRVRDALRQCVNRGSTLPTGSAIRGKSTETIAGNWEREAAVMVGSVVNALGR